MGIFEAGLRDMAIEDNIRSLVDGKLGPFNKVREIGFEEREGGSIRGACEARHRSASRELRKEALK